MHSRADLELIVDMEIPTLVASEGGVQPGVAGTLLDIV